MFSIPRVLGAAAALLALLALGAGALAAAPAAPPLPGARPLASPTAPAPPPCGTWAVVRSPNVNPGASGLQSVAVVGASDAWAVGGAGSGSLTGQTLTEHWDGTAWTVVPSPNNGTGDNVLNAVAAAGAADVWAVGQAEPTVHYETLTEHWNGTAWTIVPSANAGTAGDSLVAVAVAGPSDVWAAGSYYDSAGTRYATLIEHWNGSAWTVVPSPNAGTGDNYLYGLTVAGPGDVWAVGSTWTAAPLEQTLVEHWNGSAWTIVSSPNAGFHGSGLAAVAATGPTDVWAAGSSVNDAGTHTPLTAHWDGTAWTVVPSPAVGAGDNFLYGLTARAPGDAWAVGHATVGSGDVTLALHWDGTTWTPAATPNPANNDNYFVAVGAAASGDVWAVGGQSDAGAQGAPLTAHWDGSAWTAVLGPVPNAHGNGLRAVVALDADQAWAIGGYTGAGVEQTLTERWDGTRWRPVASPNAGSDNNWLYAAAALNAADVWAVGDYRAPGAVEQTLTEHWTGGAWSIVPSPNVATSLNSLQAVAAVATDDVWAVGFATSSGPSQTLVLHWNGSAWAVVAAPSPGSADNVLEAVAAVSPSDVWAAGHYSDGTHEQTLIEHWDGTAWTVVPSPDVAGADDSLAALAVAGPGDVWAAGRALLSPTVSQTLTAHWDGHAWAIVPSPNGGPGNSDLLALAAAGPSDVWAVGAYGATVYHDTLIEHWDGSAWTVVPSPNVGPDANLLQAAAAGPDGDVWAVGRYDNGVTQTLIEHEAPCAAPPSPTPTVCPLSFSDVHPTDYFYGPVLDLACHGVISGYADGTFRPYNNTTRAQMVKIVVLGFGKPIATPTPTGAYTFADVPPGAPFFDVIETAAADGIISGYTCGGPGEPCDPSNRPYFRPNANVTRGQLSKIDAIAAGWPLLNPATGTFADVAPGSAFYTFVETAAARGVISGYTCGGPGEPCDAGNRPYFRQYHNAIRGQIAKIVDLSITGP